MMSGAPTLASRIFQPVSVASGTLCSGRRRPEVSLPSRSTCGTKIGYGLPVIFGGSNAIMPFLKSGPKSSRHARNGVLGRFTLGILGKASAWGVTKLSFAILGICESGGAVPSVIQEFIATSRAHGITIVLRVHSILGVSIDRVRIGPMRRSRVEENSRVRRGRNVLLAVRRNV